VKDEPSQLRLALHELPKKKLGFVLVVVLLNVSVWTWWRGREVARARLEYVVTPLDMEPDTFAPPWSWTAEEWRGAWPWR